ncbi:MAG: hypothetical protein LBS60_10275 [Deltaproteobacteria bacterium]|jgi:hypothetical protein|nr:hypothetical protein [Deltaproteobacteria bacterium]
MIQTRLNSEPKEASYPLKWEPKEDISLVQSRVLNQTVVGLDLYYELAALKVAGHFTLAVPWAVRTVCPHCFGLGQALAQSAKGSIYRSLPCPRCGGHGHLETMESLMVEVTPRMAEEGLIHLKGAGLFDSSGDLRGDLYIKLNLVDKLSLSH